MSNQEGNCPYCDAVNPYTQTRCRTCGEALPWSTWVNAARQGAATLELAGDGGGKAIDDGFSLLSLLKPKTVLTLAIMVLALLAVAAALKHATPGLQQITGAGSANSTGNVVADFKNANPVFQEDAQERKSDKESGGAAQ